MSIKEALTQLESGETSSRELAEASIREIDARDKEIGAFVTVFREEALQRASDIDQRRSKGEPVGGLAGIPIGIKDTISTIDGPTSGQSRAFDSRTLHGDSPTVSNLRKAGAVVIGKTSASEFAVATPDPLDESFPLPRNPWDISRWSGGSSAGSASSIAADMVMGSVGTDTGGSIRLPAAFCGVTGLKPTYGLLPKERTIPLAPTLDHVGPMARSAFDCALLLNAMMPPMQTGSNQKARDYTSQLGRDLNGFRIGISIFEERFLNEADRADMMVCAQRLVSTLESLGAVVEPVTLPYYDEISTAGYMHMIVEAFASHRVNLACNWSDYSRNFRDFIGMASFYSSSDVVEGYKIRELGKVLVEDVFGSVDVVITPTVTRDAFDFTEIQDYWDGPSNCVETMYWNSVGSPSMSIPIGWSRNGLPLGALVSGTLGGEEMILRVGDAFQSATNFHLVSPSGEGGSSK